ncbi:MAG TPA: CDP-diacylglycerol--glycerol-3-phosphate 3-phosphatidyltransferase, partial [Acholeplasma sp.]|nr:CDP-diacylglycerol--glycerol-3-phosphate 3-phosphatidyltransferase [Acholeplasma sp.]
AAATDFIDGYIARKYNQITNLGKFLDPIADKILVISAMTYLIAVNRIYFWTVIIVIFREFVVTGIRLLAVEKGEVIAASPYGKAKTITTMIAIVLMLFNNLFIPELIVDIVWYLAVLLTLISGLDYLFKNLKVFKEK